MLERCGVEGRGCRRLNGDEDLAGSSRRREASRRIYRVAERREIVELPFVAYATEECDSAMNGNPGRNPGFAG